MSLALGLALTASLLLLGALQGATEFLPVSSSGHLVIAREWLGLESGGSLSREIALHVGTLAAVFVYCRADLAAMFARGSAGLWRVVLGSAAVTGALGLPLRHTVETHLNGLFPAGCGLLVTTLLLAVVAPRDDTRLTRELPQAGWREALLLGLFQTLALAPGISRSGATLVAGLLLGYRRPDALRLAFLISIPAVGGAVVLDAFLGETGSLLLDPTMFAATALACVVGLAALHFLSVRVDSRSLRRFALYTLALGLAALSGG